MTPLVLTALELEARAIRRELAAAGLTANVEAIGIGACRMPKTLPPASRIIMAGLAGALDPSLKIGDVVVDDGVSPSSAAAEEGRGEGLALNPHPNPLPEYRARGKMVVAKRGRIHTADHLVATPAEKAALFRETGAAAVDMENAIVRRAAEAAGIAFIGIRAISDTADQAIDPAVLTIADEVGRPKPLAIAMLLIRKPGMAAKLRQLQANSHRALAALGTAIKLIF